jgi:hypothetical protein
MTGAVQGSGVARVALALVVAATVANLAFNLWLGSQGLGAPFNSSLFGHPFNSFLYEPRDRFADLLKMAMGYPGAPIHAADPRWGLEYRLGLFERQLAAFEGTPMNHFHMLPLATLMGLALRAGLTLVDPGWLVVLVLGTAAVALAAVVARASPAGASRIWFALLALVSYPALFAFDRGHVFALTCGISLIAATVRSVRMGKADWVAIA